MNRLIVFVLIFYSFNLYSQSEKRYDINSSDLPQCVNLMYLENVDEGKVIEVK